MTDPLDFLRTPAMPVAPDPQFAAALRARLERAFLDPKGPAMPIEISTAQTAQLRTLTPYLAVADARQAIEFYAAAFGAELRGEPYLMPDGRIGHAELAVRDCVLMLADESPESDHISPATRGGSVGSMLLQVPDVDAAVGAAVARGATLTRPVADYDHGRNGVVLDPFGYRWIISAAPAASAPAAPAGEPVKHGDVSYLTYEMPDSGLAREFYGAVLGWRFTPGRVPDGWNIEGTRPMSGLAGGRPAALSSVYEVADLDLALRAVREQGGDDSDPTDQPYGRIADCTDNQGVRFSLLETDPAAD